MDVLKAKVLRAIASISERGYRNPSIKLAGEIAEFIRSKKKDEQSGWLMVFEALCILKPQQVSRYEAALEKLWAEADGQAFKEDGSKADHIDLEELLARHAKVDDDEAPDPAQDLHKRVISSITPDDEAQEDAPDEAQDIEDLHRKAIESASQS